MQTQTETFMQYMPLPMCSIDSNLNVLELEHNKTLKHDISYP